MKLGISLPTTGSTASADTIGTVAETAERIGLDTVWSFERLLSPTAGGQMNGQIVPLPDAYDSVYSPLEVLAFAAARTSRITLRNLDDGPVEEQLARLTELVGAVA